MLHAGYAQFFRPGVVAGRGPHLLDDLVARLLGGSACRPAVGLAVRHQRRPAGRDAVLRRGDPCALHLLCERGYPVALAELRQRHAVWGQLTAEDAQKAGLEVGP